jgi:hypothetical protein
MRTWLVSLSIFALANAGEKRIGVKDVPKIVLESVSRQHPEAKTLGYARERDHGEVRYEVSIQEGERRIDVELSPEGEIVCEEESIRQSDLPRPVLAALARYRGWKILSIERVTRTGAAPVFEVSISLGNRRIEKKFAADGHPVSD